MTEIPNKLDTRDYARGASQNTTRVINALIDIVTEQREQISQQNKTIEKLIQEVARKQNIKRELR